MKFLQSEPAALSPGTPSTAAQRDTTRAGTLLGINASPSLPPSWPFCCWADPTNRDNCLDLPGVSHSEMPALPFRLMQNNCFPFSRLQLWLTTSRNRSHQAEPFLILQRLSIHLVDQVELLFSFLFPSDFNEFEGKKKKKKKHAHLL